MPGNIIELWIDSAFEVVASPEILLEYELVLRRFERKMPLEELLGWIDFAKSRTQLVTPSSSKWPEIACRDLADEKFLTCALAGRANYLITGDLDLLSLRQEFPFRIIQAARFLKELQ